MYPPRRPLKRCIEYWIFRFKNGFFPSDCWNLDHELALWLLPRLKHFKATTCGYPYTLSEKPYPENPPEDYDWDANFPKATMEDWQAVLDEMIEGFELKIAEWDDGFEIDYQIKTRKIARAFELLGKHGQGLWD